MSEATFNADHFRTALGQAFTVLAGDQPQLLLAEVRNLSGDTVREDRQPFSLLFHHSGARVDQAMPQQIYALRNDTLGEIALFLVCLGPDLRAEGRPLIYEAIFS